MSDIKTVFERTARALQARPSLGHSTATTTARVREGMVCEIEEGPWRLRSDMPKVVGGTESAPTPGVYGRAALASCLATGYVLYAAKLGVPMRSIEVEVSADCDDGALFGVSDAPPGYLEVRYVVRVESSAPQHDVERVLDEGDRHSPYLDVFRRALKCVRTVKLNGG